MIPAGAGVGGGRRSRKDRLGSGLMVVGAGRWVHGVHYIILSTFQYVPKRQYERMAQRAGHD